MNIQVAAIAVLLFSFVFIYVAWAVYRRVTPDITVEVVRMRDMDTQRSAMGMIVRDETVFYAPRDGRFTPAIGETERVRQGVLVANIQDVETTERIERDIRDAEEEIRNLTNLRHFFESDAAVQRIDGNLRSTMNANMHNFSLTNLSELNSLHDRITQLTDNRNQIISTDSRDAVGDVGRLHINLQAQLSMNSVNMYAARTGIMSTIIDRHENLITPANMREATREMISHQVDHTELVPIRDVQASDPVFKLVGNTWYVVSFMPRDMVRDFVQGTERTIFLLNAQTGSYDPVLMRIEYLEHRHTDSLVIFRSSRNVMGFLNQRNVSIRTTNYVATGLMVSSSAISTRRYVGIPTTHVHGNVNYYVRHINEYGISPVPILVSSRTDNTVYVLESELTLIMGDVLAPVLLHLPNYTITESAIKRVHGVYRTNRGYASFVAVNLDGELEVDGYTMLDPSRNPNLSQFDTIVTDASTVTHRQIIP